MDVALIIWSIVSVSAAALAQGTREMISINSMQTMCRE